MIYKSLAFISNADIRCDVMSEKLQNQVPFDQEKFFMNFHGMEDIAVDAIKSFIDVLPRLIAAIDSAIERNNNRDLELSAHALKGSVSNFFAEPTQQLAWQLEQMGHKNELQNAKSTCAQMKVELAQLKTALSQALVEKGCH